MEAVIWKSRKQREKPVHQPRNRHFDKVRQVKQAYIVSNKRLGAVLKHVQDQQQKQVVERSQKAPKRRGQRRIAAERFREVNPVAP